MSKTAVICGVGSGLGAARAEEWNGLMVAAENRCNPYDRSDYF